MGLRSAYKKAKHRAGKFWTGENYSARKANSSDSWWQGLGHNYANTLTSPRGWAKLYGTGAVSNYAGASSGGAAQGATNAGQSGGAVAGAGTTGGVGATAGGSGGTPTENSYSTYQGYEAQKQTQRDAAYQEELARQQQEQQSIDDKVGDLQAEFGDYSGTDDIRSKRSSGNRLAIDAGYNQYAKAYADYFGAQLNDQYDVANRSADFSLAERGQVGGSVDRSTRRRGLTELATGKQKIAAGAADSVSRLRANDQERRIRLEGLLREGGGYQSSVIDGMHGYQSDLQNAQTSLPGETLGQAFTIAGDSYRNDQVRRGRRSLQPMDAGSSSSSGITS